MAKKTRKVEKGKSEPSKMGRPQKEFSWDQLESLCAIQCTYPEIEAVMRVSIDTLDRRCKEVHGVTFAVYFAEKRKMGKASVRRALWTQGIGDEKRNKKPVPQITKHLAEQYLGHKRKHQHYGNLKHQHGVTPEAAKTLVTMSRDQIKSELLDLVAKNPHLGDMFKGTKK